MIRYALVRLLYASSLLAGLFFATFFLFRVAPSDPARLLMGPNASEGQVAALRHELGLDQPLSHQLARYGKSVASFDFGRSFVDGRRVAPEIIAKTGLSALLVSLTLGVCFLYLAWSCFMETVLQIRGGDALDLLWISTPSFFSGVLISLVVLQAPFIPHFTGRWESAADLLALVPPALALALYPMAILSRILRREIRQLRNAPHVVAAKALNLSPARVIGSRIVRVGAVPILSALSTLLPMLFTGAYVVEVIFSLPATGTLLMRSLLYRDWPMIEALVLVNGLLVVSAQLVVELIYPIVDPRIQANVQ